MSTVPSREDPLVARLEEIARGEDRATLAALRGSLQEGHALEGLRVVLPYLSRTSTRQAEDDGLLLAGLFALHPESGSLSLAGALRLLAVDSESVEQRFRALLAASRVDLGTHLRHAVSLVASKGHALDWHSLHRAIRHWEHDSDFVRRAWARDFWSPESNLDDSDPTTA
jgi:CRISPR type I-E-associated protein CasB/Cse2